MARYMDSFERINLGLEEIGNISGGAERLMVNTSDVCQRESGVFSLLAGKDKKWQKAGSPKTCEFCWNLKYDNGFYCDAQ